MRRRTCAARSRCALCAARSALRWARLGDTRRVVFSACAAEMTPFREGVAFPCQCGLKTSRTCTVPCLSTEKRRQLGITLTTSLHRRACSRLSAAAVAVTTTAGDIETVTLLLQIVAPIQHGRRYELVPGHRARGVAATCCRSPCAASL
eukprot:scaffold83195_cov36-Phaeocystis_antarctica.AAC.2